MWSRYIWIAKLCNNCNDALTLRGNLAEITTRVVGNWDYIRKWSCSVGSMFDAQTQHISLNNILFCFTVSVHVQVGCAFIAHSDLWRNRSLHTFWARQYITGHPIREAMSMKRCPQKAISTFRLLLYWKLGKRRAGIINNLLESVQYWI